MYSVAIIGSGPAGLACAELLAKNGLEVLVFDELKEFGGMVAYGIPEFRIPLSLTRERISELQKKGIRFQTKKVTSVKLLLKSFGGEFDFVVLAIGAGEGAKAGFKGEESDCVIDAIDFLMQAKLDKKLILKKDESVAVIGGGNAAVDAARTALRQCKDVTILYRRTEEEMPALRAEIKAAKEEGVKIDFLVAPKELIDVPENKMGEGKAKELICSKMILGEKDASGRKKPIDSGKVCTYLLDKLIVAVGQNQELLWLEKDGVHIFRGLVKTDLSGKTSLDKVYACGDCVSGAKTIGEAVKAGVTVAKAIMLQVKK